MSAWHRENPELAGTWADPWMQHESYRKALPHALPEDREVSPSALSIGQRVIVDFDGRGLAEMIDQQNGMIGARYLHDPARTSRNVRVGEVEWHAPADLRAA